MIYAKFIIRRNIGDFQNDVPQTLSLLLRLAVDHHMHLADSAFASTAFTPDLRAFVAGTDIAYCVSPMISSTSSLVRCLSILCRSFR